MLKQNFDYNKMLAGQCRKVSGEEKIAICFGNGNTAYMKIDKESLEEFYRYNPSTK